MIRKSRFNKIIYALIIGLALLIAGCSPQKTSTKVLTTMPLNDTSTPEPVTEEVISYGTLCKIDLSYIRFPDGSELFLGPETEIEILTIPDLSTETPNYEVLLRRGFLVIQSQPPQDIQFTVISPGDYIAQLTGYLMYVGIEQDTTNFKAICLAGECNLGSDPDSLQNLAAGREGWLDKAGDFQGPFEIDLNALREGCGEDYISVVIPPTPVPDLDATATAFCGEFEEEYPGTPCP